MIAYSFRLALLSLRQNVPVTTLICVAVAIGIAGCMSTYTIYYAMSGDPIPWKSAQLFTPQVDNWGPGNREKDEEPSDQLSYQDATGLLRNHQALRQAAMYHVRLTFAPEDANQAPFNLSSRATSSDFFRMFDVPFRSGLPWTIADDQAHANVAVLSAKTADRLFPGRNAVGATVTLNDHAYRVVGVINDWNPEPKFYDLAGNALADSEDVFIPFETAIERAIPQMGSTTCQTDPDPGSGWQGVLNSDCTWIQYWVELPTAADVTRYRQFLNDYASEQRTHGRFNWAPLTRLRNVREWLAYRHVVSDQLRAITLISFAFLVVCLVNAIGLMLVKFTGSGGELVVRRALGASRLHVFVQCLCAAGAIGTVGGIVGWLGTELGVAAERVILPGPVAHLAQMNFFLTAVTLLLAISATLLAGVYPAWRVSKIQPAQALKSL